MGEDLFWKKVEKTHSQKRLNFRVGFKLAHFLMSDFLVFFIHNSLQIHQIINVWGAFKNSVTR